MIAFRKIALTLLGFLTLIGCKDESGKSKTEENNFEKKKKCQKITKLCKPELMSLL